MFKRLYLALFAALLLALPAFAQEATQPPPSGAAWTVSLYDQATGTVTRLAPTGESIGQFTLPLPEGFDTYSNYIATSPLGNYIAYIVEQVGDSSSLIHPSRLVVYNTADQSITASYDLLEGVTQEGFNAATDALTFSADGTRLITAYYVPNGETTFTSEIVALDVTTGEVINTINGDTFTLPGVHTGSAYRTRVLSFQDDLAILRLEPVFFAENLSSVVLIWNVETNTVDSAVPELTSTVDYLPATREALLLTFDEATATETPEPGMFNTVWNTVQLFSLASGDNETIYTADGLNNARFVQNGERIMVFSDFSNGTLINRDGSVVQEFPNIFTGNGGVQGTPTGFIYFNPQVANEITFVTTSDDSFTQTPISTEGIPFTSVSVQDYHVIPPS